MEETTGTQWEPTPGVYKFKIDDFEECTFNSGNKGAKAKLLVDAGAPWGDSKSLDCLVFTEKMLWKMKKLCECVGVDFDPPPEAFEFVNKTGSAEFIIEEYNGYRNLKVKNYITDVLDGDDVPF
jgi:hypothetical protein